ncbi:MAG: pyridoxamine 5'-phosphate oxidase family protein [Casimicrobiaceae bacterium]
MTVTQATTADRRQIWKHLQDTRFGFFTTLSEDNGLRARPLTTQKVEAEKTVWFFIANDGQLAADVRANPRALLTYSNAGDSFYASMSGSAQVLVDPARARDMWSKLNEAWFPGGPDDPNLALLRVDVTHGESWEPSTNKMLQFLSIATAAMTHTPPKMEGAHKTFQ